MTRILFVCFGNICRSPMAEFIMKDLVKKNGLSTVNYHQIKNIQIVGMFQKPTSFDKTKLVGFFFSEVN